MKVLDHGYVELVETWGSDERIIEAARQSTQKGFLGWGPVCKGCGAVQSSVAGDLCPVGALHVWEPRDERLLEYLWTHRHATPFEFAGMVVEVQAPIFVFREWQRHRTQSYNEMSARYAPLPDLNYVPTVERLTMRDARNKQAQGVGGTELTEDTAEQFRGALCREYGVQEYVYQEALSAGVPKELARLVLPVGRYSRMRASANLRNWLGFLTLRLDAAAQWEVRQYAGAVGTFIADAFPRTWKLFHTKEAL